MQRVTRSSAAPTMPPPPASPGAPGFFTAGNPGGGVPATVPGQEWFNGVQEELIAAIVAAGLSADAAVLTQLRQAMVRLAGGQVSSLSAGASLTADQAGLVVIAIASAQSFTLPAASAAGGRPIRFTFARTDTAAAVATIQRAGSDLIEGLTSIALPIGARLTLVSDGVSAWRAISALTGRSQVFTAGGAFVVPAGVFRVHARVWGGGGGGGNSGSAPSGGGGGGGGGYTEGWFDVVPGQSIPVTVGAGGASGGGNGGSSSFGALCSATGGNGGSGSAAGSGAPGGAAGHSAGGALGIAGQGGNGGSVSGGVGLGGSGGSAHGSSGGSGTLQTAAFGLFPGGGGSGGGNGFSGASGAQGCVVVAW